MDVGTMPQVDTRSRAVAPVSSSTSTTTPSTTATTTAALSRPSLKSYHASLSTHLSSILKEEISGAGLGSFPILPGGARSSSKAGEGEVEADVPVRSHKSPVKPITTVRPSAPAAGAQGKMYTDLKALAERDKEHLTAWYLEGYKRYIGGVNPGFVLLRQEDNADETQHASERDDRQDQVVRGRKRRYTEEPGLLERRRKVLRMSLEQGRVEAVPTPRGKVDEVVGRRSGSAVDHRQLHHQQVGSRRGSKVVSDDEAESHLHHLRDHGEIDAGHYISPLITPGLAFVPTPFEEMNNNLDATGTNKGGLNFGQAVGRKSMGMSSSAGSSGGSITGSSTGFNLSQPPANRGAIEERRMRRRAMTGSSSGSISGSSGGARQWVSPTLTMTNMTARSTRPTMQPTPSSNSLAFVSASHLSIALPSQSSPVYMVEHQQQQPQQHHHQHAQHGRARQNSQADAALGTTSSAGLTSLTAASLSCRTHEGLTGGSSGLMAGASLVMAEMSTPVSSSQRHMGFEEDYKESPRASGSPSSSAKSYARDFGYDAATPGLLPSFGLGGEMISTPDDPRDAVEVSSPAIAADNGAHAFSQHFQTSSGLGLGLVDEMMGKTRPTMLQRATSSFMNPDKWTLPTPGSEGTTPVDVAWDKWLRADDDSPAPTS